eukprot:Nk52_evm4s1763 gene=Nk52_evmTU4s1763
MCSYAYIHRHVTYSPDASLEWALLNTPAIPDDRHIQWAKENLPKEWSRLKLKEYSSGKRKIPKYLWITWNEVPSTLPEHTKLITSRNPKWHLGAVSDEDCQVFMNHFFKGTSILWAYNNINPKLGAMKADIWRYATLYVYGGVYVDADCTFDYDLDKMLKDDPSFVYSCEERKLEPLYADKPSSGFFAGEMAPFNRQEFLDSINMPDCVLGQFLLISEPKHQFFKEALNLISFFIKEQYFGRGDLLFRRNISASKRLLYTTGPNLLTVSVRKAIWENSIRQEGKEVEELLKGLDSCGIDYECINAIRKADEDERFMREHKEEKHVPGHPHEHWRQVVKKEGLLRKYAEGTARADQCLVMTLRMF